MSYDCPKCGATSRSIARHVGASTEWLDLLMDGPTLRQSVFDVRPMLCKNEHYWEERELSTLHPSNDWSLA